MMTKATQPQWIVLATFPGRYEAEMEKQRLEKMGIPTQMLIDDAGGVYPSLGFLSGARLLVQTHDLKKAQEILHE